MTGRRLQARSKLAVMEQDARRTLAGTARITLTGLGVGLTVSVLVGLLVGWLIDDLARGLGGGVAVGMTITGVVGVALLSRSR
jgi:F0F1-type ATP synthase assembly protein I